MHEFSICERIVETVLNELADRLSESDRLCSARVVVGGLHQIVPDYLSFAYAVLTRDTDAEGSELEVHVTPVVARCRSCSWEGGIELPVFRCAACRSLDLEMLRGKELYLEHLEIESHADSAASAVENRASDGS